MFPGVGWRELFWELILGIFCGDGFDGFRWVNHLGVCLCEISLGLNPHKKCRPFFPSFLCAGFLLDASTKGSPCGQLATPSAPESKA